MTEGDEDEREVGGEVDLGRVLALSDGVFAIALTLLVLDIRIPDEVHGEEFLRAMAGLEPAIAGYLISYLVIGVLWLAHHRLFRELRVRRSRVMSLNMLLLALVALLPFPSSLLAKHGDEALSYAIYAGNVIAVFAVQSLIIFVSQHYGDITPKPGRFPRFGWYLQPIGASVVFVVWAVVAITGHPGQANYAWWLLVPIVLVTRRLNQSKQVLTQS
ncbi:TMEM175 family protein [Kutzneria sp. NPDC052558]|uniref:TMEM175 family protein n=1 Tax=Kutzneria sp. NPDC052558 TaxID=3364121 RepID=UPI0037C58566